MNGEMGADLSEAQRMVSNYSNPHTKKQENQNVDSYILSLTQL